MSLLALYSDAYPHCWSTIPFLTPKLHPLLSESQGQSGLLIEKLQLPWLLINGSYQPFWIPIVHVSTSISLLCWRLTLLEAAVLCVDYSWDQKKAAMFGCISMSEYQHKLHLTVFSVDRHVGVQRTPNFPIVANWIGSLSAEMAWLWVAWKRMRI